MLSVRSLSFLALIAATSLNAAAQEQVSSRRVDAVGEAQASELVVNQIDTSEFPKVSIFATVAKAGVPVQGLGASDFRVREDEVDQEPLTVVPKLTPLSVAVTIDTSGSMKKAMSSAQVAALSFIKGLESEDKVVALGFAKEVRVLAPLSAQKAQSAETISQTVARGDTALFDALYRSLEELKSASGRKAVILLSDGVDDDGTGRPLSTKTLPDILALARSVNAPIYAIGLGAELDEATLREVSEKTGGAYYHAPGAEQLKTLYDGIGKKLAGQYLINYTSNLPADGSTHRVQLAHAGKTSVKEFLAPGNASVAASVLKTQEPPTRVTRTVVTKGTGRISIPNLSDRSGRIYVGSATDDKHVGVISSDDDDRGKINYKGLDLPAGTYTLQYTSSEFEYPVE